uniref:DUF4817 domain-containing protein n=1 Tax=Acrobeloides nanus TaxID=290746 RepID=A0A914CKN6_9BILA
MRFTRALFQTANRVLTPLERAKLVCWFEETNSLAMVARRYRAEFGMDPPNLSQIKKWHKNFMATGTIRSDDAISAAEMEAEEKPTLASLELEKVLPHFEQRV